MSITSVRAFFQNHAPHISIHETELATATVQDAAVAHGVAPAEIAKTLSFWAGEQAVLVVLAGDARLDNRKFRDHFGVKPKMLNAEEVLFWTGHPVGGVCPFGLAHPLPVYLDRSLQRFEQVLPAAGSINSAVRISPQELAHLVAGTWVDLGKLPEQLAAETPATP